MESNSELFFKSVVENSSDATVGTDESGKIVFWNRGAFELFGFIKKEALGSPVSIICAERSDGSAGKGFREYIEDGMERWQGQVTLYNKCGKELSLAAVVRRVVEEGETCYYCVLPVATVEALEKQVEKLDAELREFAYIISHDLKAPLRAVTILSEWILTDYYEKLDDEGKERVKLLVGRAKKMQSMIDGVLQYSRVGRGGEEVEEVDLNKLVTDVAERLERLKGIRVRVEERLPVVFFDEMRLSQVFHNLIMNGIQSLGEKRGEITIGCCEDARFWTFSVSDEGKGISEKDFGRIFTIFQTLDSNEESETDGVGLTIVKRIVEISGGEIWVKSKVGEGSTFFFTILKGKAG